MLNEEQIGKVRLMLATSGWRDVLKPAVQERTNNLIKSAMIPGKRTGLYEDMPELEVIRHIQGRVTELEWMMVALENEVKVYDSNKRLEELERQEANGAANPL